MNIVATICTVIATSSQINTGGSTRPPIGLIPSSVSQGTRTEIVLIRQESNSGIGVCSQESCRIISDTNKIGPIGAVVGRILPFPVIRRSFRNSYSAWNRSHQAIVGVCYGDEDHV